MKCVCGVREMREVGEQKNMRVDRGHEVGRSSFMKKSRERMGARRKEAWEATSTGRRGRGKLPACQLAAQLARTWTCVHRYAASRRLQKVKGPYQFVTAGTGLVHCAGSSLGSSWGRSFAASAGEVCRVLNAATVEARDGVTCAKLREPAENARSQHSLPVNAEYGSAERQNDRVETCSCSWSEGHGRHDGAVLPICTTG